MGEYSGTGTLYENGARVYSGEFEKSLCSGSGTLYGSDGTVTVGTFKDGSVSGAAVRTYPNGMKYDGCFAGNIPEGTGTLTDAAGNMVYSGQFSGGDIAYGAIAGMDASEAAELFPGAVRTVQEDGFLLTVNCGIVLECSFAEGDVPAKVRAVYAVPVGGISVEISSAEDIPAEGAYQVDSALPGIAEALGVSGSDVKCWAAAENGAVRYWWTSPDGVLLMNSAAAGTAPESPADSAGGSDDEHGGDIERLFEEIGLDIRDFESLGFKGGDDEA